MDESLGRCGLTFASLYLRRDPVSFHDGQVRTLRIDAREGMTESHVRMNEYILFMHNDARGAEDASAWNTYLARLRETDQFDGGSSIGGGVCVTKSGKASTITTHLDGYPGARGEHRGCAAFRDRQSSLRGRRDR
jgi:hypothetical protein